MLAKKQIDRLLGKLKRFEKTIVPLIFEKTESLPVEMAEVGEQRLHAIPESGWKSAPIGTVWGGEKQYCWFRGSFIVKPEYAGIPLYLRPSVGGVESMLWVNGEPHGIFTSKGEIGLIGHHYCDMISASPAAGEKIDIALETYAGHYQIGCQPMMVNPRGDFRYTVQDIDICVRNEVIYRFYFDLKVFNQMADTLDGAGNRT